MKFEIEKEDKFLYIKAYKMESGEISYKKDNIYTSKKSNCLTDEQNDSFHVMNNSEQFFNHFKYIEHDRNRI